MLRLFTWLVRWPRKHRYHCPGLHCDDHELLYRCTACDKLRLLDRHEVRALPWSEARCRRGRDVPVSEVMQAWLALDYAIFDCYEAEDDGRIQH